MEPGLRQRTHEQGRGHTVTGTMVLMAMQPRSCPTNEVIRIEIRIHPHDLDTDMKNDHPGHYS